MFFFAAMFLASTCTCAVHGKRRLLESAHVQVLAKNMAAKKNTLRFCSRSYVSVCKYSVASLCFMGGPPTDLKNMADRQEWKGQRFKKIYVRKITQHEEKFS